MKNNIKFALLATAGITILLFSCATQSKDDTSSKESDVSADKIHALEEELARARKEREAALEELEAAQQRMEATNRVIIESYGRLVDTRAKAMSEAALYEQLLTNLAAEVDSQQLTIEQMQSGVKLNLPEAVLFDSGSARVKQSGVAVLNKVANELQEVPYQTIVGGFTDNVPISSRLAEQFPSNWDLAAARATSVVRLLEKNGVPKGRLVVVSLGENQPVAPNDTAEGRAKNRRIEIRLRPVMMEE
jgi:chemotaxis protein MotB